MRLAFTKMHGLGNDFVLLDALAAPIELDSDRVRHIADRHFGVGCDQVLLLEPARAAGAHVHYRIFNADGSEAGHCGNGVRCVARYLLDRVRVAASPVRMEMAWGEASVVRLDDGRFAVDMGVPALEPEAVPFLASVRASTYPLEVDSSTFEISALSMGNPHAVLRVPCVDTADVSRLGPAIEGHPRFPTRVNVGFMQVVDRGHVRLRVHERGAGETLACGTGACAAVVAGRLQGLLDEVVQVALPGGALTVSWAGEGRAVQMAGPAEFVFEGSIDL